MSEETAKEKKSKRLSLDEAMDIITEIARSDEGPDRFRALKIAMSQETGGSQLPAPLNDQEIVERLARLIRAAGPTAAMLAYRKAFPSAKRDINHTAPKVTERDIAPIDPATLPKNLRELYRMFPEIKRPGVPAGFPVHRGIAVQKEWCQTAAKKMILDREQKKIDMIATEAAVVADFGPSATEEVPNG